MHLRLTYILLIANVVVFLLLGLLDPKDQLTVFTNLAFSVENLLGGRPWTLVTSLFLHGSLLHLGLNMIALFFFGSALENEVHNHEYLVIYFLGGVAGNLLSALVFPPDQLSVGASGAIFSLMGAAMLVRPFEFVAFPWIIPIPIVFVGIVLITTNVILFLNPPPNSNISFAAHIGGLTVGILYGMRRRGIVKSLVTLAIAFIVLLLVSSLLSALHILDYTRAIQILGWK